MVIVILNLKFYGNLKAISISPYKCTYHYKYTLSVFFCITLHHAHLVAVL